MLFARKIVLYAQCAVLRVHYSPLNCLSGSTGAVRVGEVVAQIAV